MENELSEQKQIENGVGRGCLFDLDLFKPNGGTTLRGLNDLPEFILGERNLKIIRYADRTVLMTNSERQLKELLDEVVGHTKKKGLTVCGCKQKRLFKV